MRLAGVFLVWNRGRMKDKMNDKTCMGVDRGRIKKE